MPRRKFSATDLNQLRRQSPSGATRLPEDLWISAAALALTHGVGPVARALRLDYNTLKRQVPPPAQAAPLAAAPFVELRPRQWLPQAAIGCRIEVSDPTGARMTLELPCDPATVAGVAQAFWRRVSDAVSGVGAAWLVRLLFGTRRASSESKCCEDRSSPSRVILGRDSGRSRHHRAAGGTYASRPRPIQDVRFARSVPGQPQTAVIRLDALRRRPPAVPAVLSVDTVRARGGHSSGFCGQPLECPLAAVFGGKRGGVQLPCFSGAVSLDG